MVISFDIISIDVVVHICSQNCSRCQEILTLFNMISSAFSSNDLKIFGRGMNAGHYTFCVVN
jgi:hypothetical protein